MVRPLPPSYGPDQRIAQIVSYLASIKQFQDMDILQQCEAINFISKRLIGNVNKKDTIIYWHRYLADVATPKERKKSWLKSLKTLFWTSRELR